jgi:DNA invertase Pin-like site-specific DNA recombinase
VASGARFDRKSLQALLRALKPGSTLVVSRLDRLARSTFDLLSILKAVSEKDCTFRSLAEPWADTTTPAGRLMLTILGGLAEFERELIKIRTGEGRERAKRAGIFFKRRRRSCRQNV